MYVSLCLQPARAVAAANGIEFLLTWNCRHLANAALAATIEEACQIQELSSPRVATPEQLLEVDIMEDLIIEEIRAAREAYARRFNYDLEAMIADLQKRTEESRRAGREVVSLPPRPLKEHPAAAVQEE